MEQISICGTDSWLAVHLYGTLTNELTKTCHFAINHFWVPEPKNNKRKIKEERKHLKPGWKPSLCEGALKNRNTRECYSSNSRAFGPQLCTSVEEET